MSAQHSDPTGDDIAALLRRANRAVTEGGLRERTAYFWNGYRKALDDLTDGTGRRLAAKDRLTHQAMSLLQGNENEFSVGVLEAETPSAGALVGSGRLACTEGLVRDEARVLASSIGIEFQPLGLAPGGELVRVKVSADNFHPLSLERLAACLSSSQPLIVGVMEFVTILEHGAHLGEVLALEPGESYGLDLHGELRIERSPNVTASQQDAAR